MLKSIVLALISIGLIDPIFIPGEHYGVRETAAGEELSQPRAANVRLPWDAFPDYYT
jgi:hypothetical protein